MNAQVQIALFGWPVVALAFFVFLPPRRAVLASIFTAWLFLPVAVFDTPGVRYDRGVAASVGALLGVLFFDIRRLLSFRPRWYDLPMCLVCFSSIPSSLMNDLGFKDGAHASLSRIFELGIPYVMGRIYFHSPRALTEVATGLFISGLIYVPLCLFEVRFSPQLHTWVYGYHQHSWAQSFRYGGWRPVVFMSHGLEVGLWMTAATLCGAWLWFTGAVQRVFTIPIAWLVPPLLGTTILCKSTGAVVLLASGLLALLATRWARTKAVVVVLLLLPLIYVPTRATSIWSGDEVISFAKALSEDRAESVHYRFFAEDLLAHHAMLRPVCGWGGWGRNRSYLFNKLEPIVHVDGLWIIYFGTNGVIGLAGLLGTFLLPPATLLIRLKTALWSHPWCAPAAVLSVLLLLFMIDSMMNALINPIYLIATGGLTRAVMARARRPAVGELRPAAVGSPLGVS